MNERRVAAASSDRGRFHISRLLSALAVFTIGPLILAGQTKPAAPAEDAKARADVIRLENKWLAGLLAANVDAIAEVLADDFSRPSPDSGDFVSKAQLLSFYRSHLTAQEPIAKHMEGLTVTVYDSTAIARGMLTTTDSKGQVVSKLLFTDVFVRRQRRWQAVSAQENKLTGPGEEVH
jgi:Domain of unknown function (DUF4440)